MNQKLINGLYEEEQDLYDKLLSPYNDLLLLQKFMDSHGIKPKYKVLVSVNPNKSPNKNDSSAKIGQPFPDPDSLTGRCLAFIDASFGSIDVAQITTAVAHFYPEKDFESLRKQVRNICYKLWYREKLIDKVGIGKSTAYSKKNSSA